MPSQEKKPDAHPFEAKAKQAAAPDPRSVVELGPLFSWMQSGAFSGLFQGVPLLQGLMSRSDGTTSQSKGASVGWDGGLKINVDGSRKIEGDKDHVIEMATNMSYADGNASLARTTGGKMVGEDGAKLSDTKTTKVTVGKDGGKVAGGWQAASKNGDDESKHATDYSVGYGPKGMSGSLGRKEEKSDGYTTSKQGASASYDADKGVVINASSGRHTKIDDDHQMGHETTAKFEKGRAEFGHTKNSRIKDADLTGVVEEEKSGYKVGFGKGGVKGEYGHSHTTEVGGEKHTDAKKVSYADGRIGAEKSNTKVMKDADGNEVTKSSAVSGSIGLDSASGGYKTSTATKDGGSSSHAVNGSVDWDKGEASAGYSHASTSKDGTSLTAGGSATVDKHGNLTGASVNAGVESKGGTSVSVSGKYAVEAGKVEARDGKYVVSWTRTVGAGGSAGRSGGRGGASVKGEAAHLDQGTRVFGSKEEAEHFKEHAASLIPTDQPSPETVKGALALEIGESRGATDKLGGGITATGKAGVATASIGVEKGSSHGAMIERISANVFQVTVSDGSSKGISGDVGVGGAGAGKFAQSSQDHSVTVQFDLATPAGQKAFEEYNRTHKVPKKGGQVVSQTDAEASRHGTRLSFGPLGSASIASSTWDSTTHDASGKTEVHGGGYEENVTSKIPFFKGHDNMGLSLVGVEHNDTERSYALQGTVDSTDGEASRHRLAQITGMQSGTYDPDKLKSSGKWRVDVNFSAAQADQFMDEVGSEKVRDISIFESRPDVRNNLRKELKAAKTSDDRMKAIARFVAEGGLGGESMDVMRRLLFGQASSGLDNHFLGNFDYDLQLEGDKNFRGVQGRVELENKLVGYQTLMAQGEASSSTLVGSLQGELETLRKQRAEISDPKRYTDLPDELRAQQVQKLDLYIEQVRGMRLQAAQAATKLHPDQAIDPNEGATLDQEAADAKGGKGDPKLAELRRLRHQISSSDSQIDLFQFQYQTARQEASQLSGTGGVASTHDHRRQYDQIHAGASAAQGLQAGASAMLRATEDLRVRFILAMNKPEEAAALGAALLAQLRMTEAMLDSAAQAVQKERDLFAGELELEDEKYVYGTVIDGKNQKHYFESEEEMRAYNRSQQKPAAPR